MYVCEMWMSVSTCCVYMCVAVVSFVCLVSLLLLLLFFFPTKRSTVGLQSSYVCLGPLMEPGKPQTTQKSRFQSRREVEQAIC